jgi:glycosyltransferase involved in cell wall biosynthesis
MVTSHPLISCVCITKGKPALLRNAIECFKAQTYQNRELIILYESDDIPTKELCEQVCDEQIQIEEVPHTPKSTLGYLRNHIIDISHGEFICQWDDDDWYHARRLDQQFNVINGTNYDGCLMSRWLVYDSLLTKAYLSNVRLWEGSILCRREAIKNKYCEDKSIGEDTAATEYLNNKGQLLTIADEARLYIYIYHGRNTWDRGHWEFIFHSSEELDKQATELIKKIVRQDVGVTEGSKFLDQLFNKG